MDIIIKGYVGRKLFSKDSYKIYGFHPNNEFIDKLSLSEYGNITIKGELPDLVDGKEYELEVEFEKKGDREAYKVKRIINNPMEMNDTESYNFLSEITSPRIANNILNVYPDFIQMLLKGKINEIDTSKIHGVGEYILNKINKKIKDNIIFFNIISEFKEYELTLSQVQKIHDAFSSFDLLKEKMNENPYRCLCSIAGIGFKIADVKILNKNKSLINSHYRMAECILYILSENENDGNTWIDSKELYSECSKFAFEAMKEFSKVLNKDDRIYYDKENKRVSFLSTWYKEKVIAERLQIISSNPFRYEIDFSRYTSVDGVSLTEEQQLSFKYAVLYNFYVLAGNAGSGKTFSTKALINMLDDNSLSYILLAPTGKASKNLSQNTRRDAQTIHRGLVFSPQDGFYYNEKNKLPYDFVIVDEATMIDVSLMLSLLRAVDEGKTKLVFICDPAQIPSVGCGNCIQDIISSEVFPVIFLNKVFRYEDGGLAKIATETRKGNSFLSTENVQKFGDDFVFVSTLKDTLLEKVLSAYKKMELLGGTVDDIIVISAYNKGMFGTYNINSIIQDYVNPSKNEHEMSYIRDKQEIVFRVGDRVMQTINNYNAKVYVDETSDKYLEEFFNNINNDSCESYESEKDEQKTPIFNGDDGRIVKIDIDKKGHKYMIVDFQGIQVLYKGDDIRDLLLAYSISGHKSQGSGYKYVIAIAPPTHKHFLNRNLLYVMLTRTKVFIYVIGTIDTIEYALTQSENLNRKTFLKEML